MKPSDHLSIQEATSRLIDYRGKTPPKTDFGVRLITAKVVKGGRILDEPKEFISEDFYEEWMRRGMPEKGDVLITTEAPLGEVARLRDDKRIALAQRIILLRARPTLVDPDYLFYALQTEFVQGELLARSSGTTVAGIKQSELRKVKIPVPELPEQQRIAGILSAYDDLIENCQRRIKILEEMARSLYREWFVHFRYPGHESVPLVPSPLGPIPKGWRVMSASQALEINPKVKVPKEGTKPFLSMSQLSNDSMVIEPFELREGNSGSKFMNGDTLFARITPCAENGKTGFVQFLDGSESAGFGSTEFIVLRSRHVSPEYVYCLARNEDFRRHAIGSMSGASGRQRVSNRCFDSYFLPVPPTRLLGKFSEVSRSIFTIIEGLHREIRNLRTTRDLLLPKLIG